MTASGPTDNSVLLTAYLEGRDDLVRFFTARLKSSAAAEDLIQDLYVKVASVRLAQLFGLRRPRWIAGHPDGRGCRNLKNLDGRLGAPLRRHRLAWVSTKAFQTFVISLERASARRAHMSGLLRGLGLEAVFVPAVDGRALTDADRARYDPSRARVDYRCEMTDAEIACYLSHYRLYEHICREGIDLALILEDDIEVAPDLLAVVEGLSAQRDPPWSVVRLQTARPKVLAPTGAKERGVAVGAVAGRVIYRLQTHVLGGCAYLIRREAAQTMLAYGSRISRPIDQTLDRYWENGILPYVVRPFPVWQHPGFQSEIGSRGRVAQPRGHILDAARGRVRRALDGVNKRLFNLADAAGLLGHGAANGVHERPLADSTF